MVLSRFRRSAEEKAQEEEKLQSGLSKTRQGFFGRIGQIFQANEITPELYDELEELLVQADVGINTTMEVVEKLRARVETENIKRTSDAYAALQDILVGFLSDPPPLAIDGPRLLTVVMVVGVNGSGKTTSIAKLAHYYKQRERRVVVAAADTFRAAAIDQLKIWGERVGVEVIAQVQGADPGAVVFDAIRASQESRQANLLIIDTAGRQHTNYNLMKELQKVHGVAAKQVHRAPHESLIVLDATTGQNALFQARHFKEAVNVTGVILTKLDSTAKGGIVFAIQDDLGIPVRFVGTGEKLEDFTEFEARAFVSGLFDGK